jgi:hypothetical protein
MTARTFAQAWSEVTPPDRLRIIREMKWEHFQEKVNEGADYFIDTLVGSLAYGDTWILKGAFSREFIEGLKTRCDAWWKKSPSSFHKMLDDCPDFHREIDPETGKKYSIHACKHSAYFFRWNADPLGIWPTITDRWRVLKIAMGMQANTYEANKPSDGPTDRIQVVRYLPKVGYLEPHRDAFTHQPCFISGYMSKRGVDYKGGGFYLVDENNRPVYAEDMIDVGDLCIGHANLLHGVAPCDTDKAPSWEATDGRWFLGLYSNASDYETKRNTSKPEKVEIAGVRP